MLENTFLSRNRYACGKAPSPDGGWDIVVAAGDVGLFVGASSSDIFNTEARLWRPGTLWIKKHPLS